jgi:O-antigen ligase
MTWIIIGFWLSTSIVLWFSEHGLKVQAVFSLLAAGFFVIEHGTSQVRFSLPKTAVVFILCFLPLYVSVAWSHDVERTGYELLKITPGVILFFLISCIARTREDFHKIAWIMVITEFVTVGMGFYLLYTYESLRGFYRGEEELRAISGFVGFYAAFCLPTIVYLISQTKSKVRKSVLLPILILGTVTCIASATRAAILGAFVAIGLMVLRGGKFWKILASGAVILTLTGGALFLSGNLRLDQLLVLKEVAGRFSAEKLSVDAIEETRRFVNWRLAVDVLEKNLFGIGYEAFTKKYGLTNPHNALLDFGLAAGMVGLVSVGILFLATSRGYYKSWKKYQNLEDKNMSALYYSFFCAFVCAVIYAMFWQILWHPLFYLQLALGMNYRKSLFRQGMTRLASA